MAEEMSQEYTQKTRASVQFCKLSVQQCEELMAEIMICMSRRNADWGSRRA